jgi:hypothetical protein
MRMDYETYKKNFFTDPAPQPRYGFIGDFAVTLFYQDYAAAIAYYEQVLGPPAYVEGAGTRGWRIGAGWLTLLQGKSGNPKNIEITFGVATPEEADALQQAFIAAGGKGPAPSDGLMYQPIRYCPVTDPFGVDILVISPNQ